MRKTITVIGKGMTEQAAKMAAYNDLKALYKNNVLVYGMLSCVAKKGTESGKQCTTENHMVEGARKWATQHNIYAVSPTATLPYALADLKFIETHPDKTGALKTAKELALKYQGKFIVKLEKVLDGTDPVEATVTPKGAVEGQWTIQLDIETVS